MSAETTVARPPPPVVPPPSRRHPAHRALDAVRYTQLLQAPEGIHRRTGRTTAIALRLISDAIRMPDTPLDIRDHWDDNRAHEILARLIVDTLAKLELRGIEVFFSERGWALVFGENRSPDYRVLQPRRPRRR